MNYRNVIAVIVLSVVVSAAAGFWYGVKRGMELEHWTEAIASGNMAVGALQRLSTGSTDHLKMEYEADIDGGLVYLLELELSPLHHLLVPLGGPPFAEFRDWGSDMANYRKSNPSPFHYGPPKAPGLKEANPELYERLLENNRATAHWLADAINRYATKP